MTLLSLMAESSDEVESRLSLMSNELDGFIQEITRQPKSNRFFTVEAKTGSGKTTTTGVFFAKRGYRTLTLLPTREHVTSISSYVGDKYQDQKISVGYIIGGDKSNPKGNVLFATAGWFFHSVIGFIASGKGLLRDIDFVIIDEAHTTTPEYVLLPALIKELVGSFHRTKCKFIAMSATLGSYWKDVDPQATIFKSRFAETPYEIRDITNQAIFDLTTVKNSISSMISEIASFVRNLLIEYEEKIQTDRKIPPPSCLIILPGREDVSNLTDKIFNKYEGNLDIRIIQLFSESAGFKETLEDHQIPIYISTDIASTGFTFNVTYVIDSGLKKSMRTIKPGAGDELIPIPISVKDQIQRRGRVGRTRSGFYVPFFSTKLENTDEFETSHIDISIWIIKLFSVGINPYTWSHRFGGDERLKQYTDYLEEQNAILNFELTDIGKFSASLPLSFPMSKMVWITMQLSRSDTFASIVVACFFDMYISSRLFQFPDVPSWIDSSNRLEYQENCMKEALKDLQGEDAIEFALNLWNRSNEIPHHLLKDWVRDHNISFEMFEQTRNLIRRTAQRIDVEWKKTIRGEPAIREAFRSTFAHAAMIKGDIPGTYFDGERALLVGGRDFLRKKPSDAFSIAGFGIKKYVTTHGSSVLTLLIPITLYKTEEEALLHSTIIALLSKMRNFNLSGTELEAMGDALDELRVDLFGRDDTRVFDRRSWKPSCKQNKKRCRKFMIGKKLGDPFDGGVCCICQYGVNLVIDPGIRFRSTPFMVTSCKVEEENSGHVFHTDCLISYIKSSTTPNDSCFKCPLCNDEKATILFGGSAFIDMTDLIEKQKDERKEQFAKYHQQAPDEIKAEKERRRQADKQRAAASKAVKFVPKLTAEEQVRLASKAARGKKKK